MNLKRGMIGQEIIKWQKFLLEKGLLSGSLDGIFGAATEKATIEWQTANGLTADGIVGQNSFAKAKEQGFEHSIASLWYPPRPDFGSPSVAQVKAMFGEFEYTRLKSGDINIHGSWVADNIKKVEIKQLIGVLGAPADGKIRIHKKAEKQIVGFFNEVEKQGLKNLIISFAGAFYPRMVRGSKTSLSNHSWGTAFDINAPENWLGQQPAPVGKKGSLLKLVPIANSFGLFWGGHYQKRLDGMHFEVAVLDKFPS
ncbi:MAG TPA: M15 family metallopeptidase [Pyrinomonadaceae bacterium]|nr:M15 family metallopeptidase [Pyrinomonadaceae bacterium]